ncbi:MAG: cobalamin B12-binding domain-containing protein [Desulfobacterales bacterium]|nr:cobalamin B12-binding domain-containing protein [Desulfobacterales bacterium]
MKKNIRILLAKPGLDGHLRGINVLAKALMDAGMEVVYLGVDLTPNEIAQAAVEEGADIIGLSIHAGGAATLFSKVKSALSEQGGDNIPILVGGIITPKEKPKLREMGVVEIFGPGSRLQSIIRCINETVQHAGL